MRMILSTKLRSANNSKKRKHVKEATNVKVALAADELMTFDR